jgi:N,N'-diacetyllegionaminate synthase
VSLSLGDRPIGGTAAALLVAEIGSNHDGDLGRALGLIDAAASAGADAVQLHSFRAAHLVAPRTALPAAAGSTADLYAHLERVALRTEWHAALRERATARNHLFLATAFDEQRATLLAALGVVAFPVAAGDVTHLPLLRVLGGFGRPVLLGCALAGRGEVETALAAVGEGAGAPPRRPPVVLVAGPSGRDGGAGGLRAIGRLEVRYDCLAGWADRQPGHVLALGAIARGACLVAKPFTDDRTRRGPEHAVALDPAGFRAMVTAVRELETALRADVPGLRAMIATHRQAESRGVYAPRSLAAGTVLAPEDLKLVRPALGASPAALPSLLGRRLLHACAADEPVDVDDVA